MAGTVVVRELLTKFGFKVEKDKLKELKDLLKELEDAFKKVAQAATTVAVAAGAVTAAFVAQGVATANLSRNIILNADAIGISTDRYQELLFTLERFGMDAQEVTEVLAELSMKSIDAANGSKEAQMKFKMFGLTLEDIKGLSADQMLLKIADASSKIEDANIRTAAAFELLGDDLGRKMLPLLRQGSEGFERFAREAHSASAVFSEDRLRTAKAFGDVISEITGRVSAIRFAAGSGITESLEKITEQLTKFFDKNKDGVLGFITSFAEGIGEGLETLSDGFVSAIKGARTLRKFLRDAFQAKGLLLLSRLMDGISAKTLGFSVVMVGVGAAIAAVVATVGALAVAWGAFVAFMSTTTATVLGTVAAITAAIIAVGVLVDDFLAFARGAPSVFGSIAEAFSAAFASPIEDIKNGFYSIIDVIASVLAEGVNMIGDTISFVFSSAILDALASALSSGVSGISGAIMGAASGVAGSLGLGGDGTRMGSIPVSRMASRVSGDTNNSSTAVTNQTSIGGDNITINGSGMSPGEVSSVIERSQQSKYRQAASTLGGAR